MGEKIFILPSEHFTKCRIKKKKKTYPTPFKVDLRIGKETEKFLPRTLEFRERK